MNALDKLVSLNKNRNRILQNVTTIRRLGDEMAQAEYEYKKLLHATIKRIKEDSNITWSMVERYAHGDEAVAEARLKRDKKKNEYFAYIRENKALHQEVEIQAYELEHDYKRRVGS